MSATASFYLLESSKLEDLLKNAEITVKKSLFSKKVIDNYWDYLSSNAAQLKGLDGSGYVYGNLLVFLEEEKNINLLQSEYNKVAEELVAKRGSSHFIFTTTQKTSFIKQLDTANYSLAEIQKFNKDFSEEGDEETARLTLNAIQLFHDNLCKMRDDNQILLLIVG